MADLLDPSNNRLRQIIGFPLVDSDIDANANIDVTKLGTGAVDNTEFNRLNGITSALEEQGNKGASNGYAGLDGSQELLLANFPSGTALQVLRRNAANNGLEFADVTGGITTFAELTDTNIVSPQAAQLPIYDGVDSWDNQTISGDITITASGVATIPNDTVTFAKMGNIATDRLIGRVSAGTGDIELLTGAQATTVLEIFTDVLQGLAPASGGGTVNFLRADGTWASPPAGGSVALNDLTDVTITSVATGDILYKSAGDWVNLAAGTNGHVLTLVGGIPAWAAVGAAAQTPWAQNIDAATFYLYNIPSIRDGNENELLGFTTVASAVNYIDIRNAATGNNPRILVEGPLSSIGLDIGAKGAGIVHVLSDTDFQDNDITGVGTISSNTTPLPITGFMKMGPGDSLAWRNPENTLDGVISVGSSGHGLTIAGFTDLTINVPTVVNANVTVNGTSITANAYVSPNTPNATVGIVQFAEGDMIAWRNTAENNNHSIEFDNDIFEMRMDDIVELAVSSTFLDIDAKYMEIESIASPGTTGSATTGRLFMDSGNSDHVSVIRNGSVIDLEASGSGSQTPWTSNIDAGAFYLFNIPTIRDANENEVMGFSSVASAVNYVSITNSIASNGPIISTDGGDTNIDLLLDAKGTGSISLQSSIIGNGARIDGVSVFSSNDANVATSGTLRLGPGQEVAWDRTGGSGIASIQVDANDDFIFHANIVDINFNNANLQNITINESVTWGEAKQTFNPGTTSAGINVGSVATNPSSLAIGDIWHNSTDGTYKVRLAGVTENIITSTTTLVPRTKLPSEIAYEDESNTFTQENTFQSNVNMQDTITFTAITPPAHSEGEFFYDDDTKYLAFYNDQSEITMQLVGSNMIHVHNDSGGTISTGQAVYVTGAQGGSNLLLRVALAQADSLLTCETFIGLAAHDIENNTDGYVVTFGDVGTFDTSGANNGNRIWLSATVAGGITNQRPSQPSFTIPIGEVTRSHATLGSVHVNPSPIKFGAYTQHYVAFGGDDGFIKESSDFQYNDTDKKLALNGYIELDEITKPPNPSSDKARLYVRDDTGVTKLFFLDSAGVETDLIASSGSQTPWTSNINASTNYLYNIPTIRDANENEVIEFVGVASAVNYLKITNAVAGDPARLEPDGTDTNISLSFFSKGIGTILFNDEVDLLGNILRLGTGGKTIQATPPGITYNSGTGASHVFEIDSVTELDLDATKLDIDAKYIELESITPPAATASQNIGRIFMDSGNSDHLSIRKNSTVIDLESENQKLANISGNIDGGGSVITTGIKILGLRIPFAATINEVSLVGNASGDLTVRVLKATHSNFPTMTDISNGGISLSSAQKIEDSTLTGWTTSIDADDYIQFEVTGTPATISLATISLKVTKT